MTDEVESKEAEIKFQKIEFIEVSEQVGNINYEPKHEIVLLAKVYLEIRFSSATYPLIVQVRPNPDLTDVKALVLQELYSFGAALAKATHQSQ